MRHFQILQKLYEEGSLSYSKIPQKLREELIEEDLIFIEFLSASRRKIVAKEGFFEYFKKVEKVKKAQSRADLAKEGIDTKQKHIAPQDGLYIAGSGIINGIDLSLIEEGALFLKTIPQLDPDALVVGVENFENLIEHKKQCCLFGQDQSYYFVFRNKKMMELLSKVNNEVVYFGDFDLAGIAIYETSIYVANPKAEFFIPENIEQILRDFGSSKLYSNQINRYKNLKSSNVKIQNLIDLIHKYQKGLEQEFFITDP